MTPKRAACNTGLAKVAVQCFADTFVVNQTFVLRMNICGKNRQLLVAANRYVPFCETAYQRQTFQKKVVNLEQ